MSYHYGSDSPEIQNPFKKEGMIFVSSGLLIFLFGLITLFTLRSQILNSGLAFGWLKLIICILLLGLGGAYMTKGILKISRFYVGRGIPASLAKNVFRSEAHVREPKVGYQPEELEQMLMGRKNPTFREPTSLLDKSLYNIFPKFVFLPYSIRKCIHILLRKTMYSIVGLAVYLLTLLSGSIGLTQFTKTSFSSWFGIGLLLWLFLVWTRNKISVKRMGNLHFETGPTKFVLVIIFAVLIPAIAEMMLRQGVTIPDAPFNPIFYITMVLIIMAFTTAVALMLAKERSELIEHLTEVSEYRGFWEENVHPRDIFTSFDMEMTKIRYKETPNRVYREVEPILKMEGSTDKGSFKGDTIQESQPVYQPFETTIFFKKIRLIVCMIGHSFMCLSAFLLMINGGLSYEKSFWDLVDSFYPSAVLWFFGTILINIAHLYWSEILFKSYLIHFQGEGTYTESKISVGMAVTDSMRSENKVVRTAITPWIIVSEITSSTFIGTGATNLEGPRYVMDMRKAETLLQDLVSALYDHLGKRQYIANTMSEKDLSAIKDIYSLNQASPSMLDNKTALDSTRDHKKLRGSLDQGL